MIQAYPPQKKLNSVCTNANGSNSISLSLNTLEILYKDIFPITHQVCSIHYQFIYLAFSAFLSLSKKRILKSACFQFILQPTILTVSFIILSLFLQKPPVIILLLYCSNDDASKTNSVPNTSESSTTRSSRWNFNVFRPEFQWSLNFSTNYLLNWFTRYFSSTSCPSFQHS